MLQEPISGILLLVTYTGNSSDLRHHKQGCWSKCVWPSQTVIFSPKNAAETEWGLLSCQHIQPKYSWPPRTAGHHDSKQCGHGSLIGNHRIWLERIHKDHCIQLSNSLHITYLHNNKGDQKNPKQQCNTYFHAFISNDTYLRNFNRQFLGFGAAGFPRNR